MSRERESPATPNPPSVVPNSLLRIQCILSNTFQQAVADEGQADAAQGKDGAAVSDNSLGDSRDCAPRHRMNCSTPHIAYIISRIH